MAPRNVFSCTKFMTCWDPRKPWMTATPRYAGTKNPLGPSWEKNRCHLFYTLLVGWYYNIFILWVFKMGLSNSQQDPASMDHVETLWLSCGSAAGELAAVLLASCGAKVWRIPGLVNWVNWVNCYITTEKIWNHHKPSEFFPLNNGDFP